MRYVLLLLVLSLLGIPCTAQETEQFESRSGTLAGYLIETALTPESYIIADTPQMEAFVMMLPKVTLTRRFPPLPIQTVF